MHHRRKFEGINALNRDYLLSRGVGCRYFYIPRRPGIKDYHSYITLERYHLPILLIISLWVALSLFV